MKMGKLNAGQTGLTIGRLAEVTGVNVETVRYYQRIGLIEEPGKPPRGFRTYPITTVERIKFIKRAQQLGFTLREVADLLEMGDGHCHDVRIRAEAKRDKIEKQISDLTALRDTLNQLISTCRAGKDSQPCPIVGTLVEQDCDIDN